MLATTLAVLALTIIAVALFLSLVTWAARLLPQGGGAEAVGKATLHGQITLRVAQAKKKLRHHKGLEALNKGANATLVCGEFMVGLFLASSFVTEQTVVDHRTTGFLGLLVLAAFFVRHYFHLEAGANRARRRAHTLEVLVQAVEDKFAKVQDGHGSGLELGTLLDELSSGIAQVDAMDLDT